MNSRASAAEANPPVGHAYPQPPVFHHWLARCCSGTMALPVIFSATAAGRDPEIIYRINNLLSARQPGQAAVLASFSQPP